ncbi:DUF2484 family protein [Roseovarius sp. B08]|uniref:DUF2484 family protein n=1 Tax=Roseovarius sp. B08 TaxID=3449223 RepID=UPI003EDB9C73
MTLVVLCCLWVIAGTLVAMLPTRHQYAPGIFLLALAPVLIWMIGRDHGVIPAALAVLALLSMFRNPLRYFTRRLAGEKPEVPK